MIQSIDWMSISIPYKQPYSTLEAWKGAVNDISLNLPLKLTKLMNYIMSFKDLKVTGGHAPFSKAIHSPSGGFTYMESDKLPYSLVEFTGVGCNKLVDRGIGQKMLQDWNEYLTRIDIAVDYFTDVTPQQFVEKRNNDRFKSFGLQSSESGVTCYVGSKTSDRYARVYRYNPPHPRSMLLRCEFVLRSKQAQQIAKMVLDDGIKSVSEKLGVSFGFTHDICTIDAEVSKIKFIPKETHEGKTERWLFTAVLPACKRLIATGKVNALREFLEDLTRAMDEFDKNE